MGGGSGRLSLIDESRGVGILVLFHLHDSAKNVGKNRGKKETSGPRIASHDDPPCRTFGGVFSDIH